MDASALIGIFVGNLWRFDIIIFIVAFINVWCFVLVRRCAKRLYNLMHPTIFIPSHDPYGPAPPLCTLISETEVISLRKKSGILYSVFCTLTSIFTLLGILGTVASLIPMVQQMDTMKVNFLVALTSTFWGLVFAILFKSLDAFLSGRVEDNEKTVALFLDRNVAGMTERK